MVSFVALAAIAGLLAVDQRAGWQGLLGQPVFAGAVVGAAIGELPVCVCVGLLLELIYLSVVPMRGARFADHVAAGVVGSGCASLLMRLDPAPGTEIVCAVGIFVGLLAGEIGGRVTGPLFTLRDRFLSSVEFARDAGRQWMARRLLILHVSSIGSVFVVEAFLVLALAAAGYHAGVRMVRVAEPALERGALFWGQIIAAIGVASIIHLFWHHRFRNLLLACAALAVIILWIT
jgi:mannose/fructose/N-acetylgalactosamine-specific phosphotransferase system component IIC